MPVHQSPDSVLRVQKTMHRKPDVYSIVMKIEHIDYSFIGLGLPIPLASLGTLINDGFKSITVYPYMMVIPVLVFSVLMLSFNLFGDGLRDALDPTMKEM